MVNRNRLWATAIILVGTAALGQRTSAQGEAGLWDLPMIPPIVGDFYDRGLGQIDLTETVAHAFQTQGFIVSGGPGDPNGVIVFEANGGTADDFFTTGVGSDASGDGLPDTFSITEPIPPNEVPTSPGPEYSYDGGTAVYIGTSNGTTPVDGTFNDGDPWFASYSFSRTFQLPRAVAGAAMVRNVKLADNNSALPRTRLFFDYRFFNDVFSSSTDVNRYLLGFERACLCGLSSWSVRVPIAATFDNDQRLSGVTNKDVELGNIAISYKHVLFETANTVLSGGLGVGIPTAADLRIVMTDGPVVFELENESVHIMPYVAWANVRGPSTFQMFLQVDVDANGDTAYADASGNGLIEIGRLSDATRLNFDAAYSKWIYQSPCANRAGIVGLAPFVEFHYSAYVGAEDRVSGNGVQLVQRNDVDQFSITAGGHVRLANGMLVTPAVVVPLQDEKDRLAETSFALLVNRFF